MKASCDFFKLVGAKKSIFSTLGAKNRSFKIFFHPQDMLRSKWLQLKGTSASQGASNKKRIKLIGLAVLELWLGHTTDTRKHAQTTS